jgi:adenylate cyclase
MTEPIQRRLAVVLAYDVVGYSRLMEQDEEGTHRRVMDIMRDVVQPTMTQRRGRQVKGTGDGGLVEFESVVEAARWSLDVQRTLSTRNALGPADQRIEFRIGISLADIIIEPDDIYGEGVNLASRLQSMSEAGGICVTQAAAEQLRGKLEVELVDLGEPKLKNLSRPLRVFRLVDSAQGPRGPTITAHADRPPYVSGFGGRPAIAVLPLDTFSRSPDEEYFSDGLTEDITTALANWRSFPVIARNSAFTYKGRKIEIRSVGQELGARYLVEGSVRRQDSQVRVTIQLVEAETGYHLHARTYDRKMTDILGLQDEIATSIVATLEPELLRVERDRAAAAPASFAAYDLMQRGLWHHYRRTKEDSESAQAYFRKAIAADPGYAQAMAALAVCLAQSKVSGWESDPQHAIDEAFELGQRAAFLDARDPEPHFALGLAALHNRQMPVALRETEEAVRINPSFAAAWANLSVVNNYMGQPAKALEHVSRALRLSPNDPRIFLWIPALAGAHYLAGNYEDAINAGRYGLAIKPDYRHCLRYLTAALGQLGRQDEAAEAAAQMRVLDKQLADTEAFLALYYVDRKSLEHILDGLRKAGFF